VVGLVLVSHSVEIAEGVRALAEQMAREPIPIVAVGGLRQDDGSYVIGTDTERIRQAILEVINSSENQSGNPAGSASTTTSGHVDGVLVLVDLGSAVMSAETAIELTPADVQAKCLISNAPLVEGAIVAAIEASLGRSLVEVNRAAEEACHVRKVQR
jgi:dihydroxyacetone kinase DhaKLM complex PTS-EIIA-like component DhaM